MKWLPIEMAPKDGQRILLFIPGLRHRVQLGNWVDTETREYGKVTQTYQYWFWGQGNVLLGHELPEPTHWYPLPEPPLA